VTAAAASLGHDPAIFLRTYAHLYTGDLGAVADAMDAARSAVVDAQQQEDEGTSSVRAPSSVARVISRGWPDAAAKRPSGMASDLHFRVGLPGFEPGTS
jgi:hypothetical protein